MLVRPGLEPATSRSADRRLSNWASQAAVKSSQSNAIWFIKTNFLKAITCFRLSIGAIILFEVFTLAGSQTEKRLRGCQRGAYILVRQCIWIMKLLHDYNKLRGHFCALPGLPLTQCRVVFDVSVENSWIKGNVRKGMVEKFQAEIRIWCLQTFFQY